MDNVNFGHNYLVIIMSRDEDNEYALDPVIKSFAELTPAKNFFNEQVLRFDKEGYSFTARLIELRNRARYDSGF